MRSLQRRAFLQRAATSIGGVALAPFFRQLEWERSGDPGRPPLRFVFVTRQNGLRRYGIQPSGLEDLALRGGRPEALVEHDLTERALHPSMAALEPVKASVNVLQGLSARMCTGSHGARFGALGAYRVGEHDPAPAETIDSVLARAFPGIFPYLGVKMDKAGVLISHSQVSAAARNKPLPLYADPLLAYRDWFGTVLSGGQAKAEFDVENSLLEFVAGDIRRGRQGLNGRERDKLDQYLSAFEALRDRQVRLGELGLVAGRDAPELTDKFRSEVETHRLEAHFDLAASALIAGLTNVVTVDADSLDLHYSGLDLAEHSLHHIGHLADYGDQKDYVPFANGVGGREARDRIRRFQFDLIGGLASKLAAVREGDGTMLDNTLIVFFSAGGDNHHPGYFEWPVITVGGLGGKLRTGRYVHLPRHGAPGHRTIGNFYTSILQAARQPVEHFGQLDRSLQEDQRGPMSELFTA